MTSTQLRNARKRRAKQKKTRQQNNGGTGTSSSSSSPSDPSTRYLKNPKAAPLVQAAKEFFAQRCPHFSVFLNGPTTGWRTVSKLPVRRQQKRVVIGMFQPQSHQIAGSSNKNNSNNYSYAAHHPSINHAMVTVASACQELGIDAYSEDEGTGYLRYVAMNVERTTGKVQLTLIWNDAPYNPDELEIGKKKKKKSKKRKRSNSSKTTTPVAEGKIQLERLLSHLLKVASSTEEEEKGPEAEYPLDNHNNNSKPPPQQSTAPWVLHSLWVHYNAAWKHSNAIFDVHTTAADAWHHVFGPATIPEQLSLPNVNATSPPILHFAPNVFRQANLDAFAHIVAAIRQRIAKVSSNTRNNNKKVACVELYGGVGTIGLHLLDLPNLESLVCSDENPHNQACFDKGLESLPVEVSQKATYVPLNATDMVRDSSRRLLQDHCQVLIVDPPRKGLDEAVVDALVASNYGVQLLVYVSCGFDAFQRDYQSLTEKGNWRLEHADGHILFPGSNAIETLAFFVPSKK